MADQANDQGACWPSIDTIADRTCLSRRSVIDALKWLEASQVLTADRSNGRHTKYALHPDRFQPIDGRSKRTAQRKTSADAARVPVQMPHGSEPSTGADAAPVQPPEAAKPVQMPHLFDDLTSANAAPTSADAARVPVQMPHKPVQMPHSNHQEPSVEPKGTINAHQVDLIDAGVDRLHDAFAKFWAAYPRKVGKPSALKAWKKVKLNAELLDTILAAIASQRNTDKWRKNGGDYIPYPATWLNDERWTGDVKDLPASSTGSAPAWAGSDNYPAQRPRQGRHHGLHDLNHQEGIPEDGTIT